MDARETIRQAKEKIDEWVRTRPPAVHVKREYQLPRERDRVPKALAQALDRVFPPWRTAGFSSFGVASQEDAQLLDSILFQGRRVALLDAAETSLRSLTQTKLPPMLECAACAAQAYGRMQFLMWHIDLGNRPELPISAFLSAGELANRAGKLLLPEQLTEDEWIDALIRIEFVAGWAAYAVRNLQEAAKRFLFVIGWYASAEELGYTDVARRRYGDFLRSLYAILEPAGEQSLELFRTTASVLLKDLKIGRYRVKPPFVVSRAPGPAGSKRLKLDFNMSFAGDDWRRAFAYLGNEGAFMDLIVTDRFLINRYTRGQSTRQIRNELPMVPRPVPKGMDPRGEFLITPLSVVLEPSIGPQELVRDNLMQASYSQTPQAHYSDAIRWRSHFQTLQIFGQDESCSWEYQWQTWYPTFEENLWKTIYDIAFAEALSLAEKEGIRHLIISPDGSLTGVPHHLIRDSQGNRIGDKFAVSYAPNLSGVLAVLDSRGSDLSKQRFVIVQDPNENVGFSEWECQHVAAAAGSRALLIKGHEATAARIKQECATAGVLHFTGHASFEWANPLGAYLSVAGDQKLGLDELRGLSFTPGALVFLAACDTGKRGTTGRRTSSRGIVSSLLEAGAATVICSLWPVESAAAALVAHWFYEGWLLEGLGRLESLRRATKKLRESKRWECEAILKRRLYFGGEAPFQDEAYWGAFVLYGAW